MSQSIQLQVTQVGLEQSIAAAMKRVGSSSQINLGTSSKQINALSQPLGRITGQADEFSKSMAAANARVLAFGASAGIIAGVSKAMSGLLTSTIKVEKSLVEISTVLNKTGSELDKFGQDIFNVAKNTGKSFDEVASGALELARQGLNAEDTLIRLNDALILSRLSGLDAAQSVEGLTAAFNSFKSSGITTAEILNKVVAASQKYAVSERDIIEGLKRSASVANLAGVSFEELAAVITAVQEKTARGGAVIGNAFKTIFSRIQDKAVLSDLDKMGVAVTNLQGEVLPALRILENLADKMGGISQIEQADIAKKLGGVYQLDKLLAALSDLSDEASVTTGALKAMSEAGNSAYKKNAVLNETLAALLNKVAVSAEQLGAKLGEIGVTDNLKNVLGIFNDLLEGIQKVLGEESGLGNLVRGLVKGLGSFLAGPGLALFGGIILKLSKDLVQFGFASLKAFFGIGKAAKEVQNVEGSISQILAKNVNLQQQLFALEGNRAAQLRVITSALVEQEAVLRRSSKISSGLAAPLYNVGGRAKDSGLRIGNSAGGYMPAVAKESKAIKQGVGGARAGDKPVVVPNFNFGGGKKGTMVAHTGEYIVPNFNGSGGSAVFNRRMVQSMGLPSGAKKINAAGGLVPAPVRGYSLSSFAGVRIDNSRARTQFGKNKNENIEPDDKISTVGFGIEKIPIPEELQIALQENKKYLGRSATDAFELIAIKHLRSKGLLFKLGSRSLFSETSSSVDGYNFTNVANKEIGLLEVKSGNWNPLDVGNKFGRFLPENVANDRVSSKINPYFTESTKQDRDLIKLKNTLAVPDTERGRSFIRKDKNKNEKLSYSGFSTKSIATSVSNKAKKTQIENAVNAASGFIPNFAEVPRPKAIDDEIRKYVEAGTIQNYIRPGLNEFGKPYRSYWFPDGTQAAPSQVERVMKSSRAVGAVRKEEFEKKVEDSKPLTLSADQLGGIALISPRFGGNGIGSLDTQMKIAEIGGGLIYAKGAALASRKNSYLKLTGIKTTATPMKQTVDGENGLEGAIGDTFAQGIVDLAYKLYGRVFAQKTNWVDELKTLATKKGQQLLPPAAQGDLFEAAGKVAVNTLADVNAKDKEGKSIGIFSGTEQNRPFDFSNSAGIKEIFGINAQRGEAKRGGEANFEGSNQVKGIIKKVFNDSVYAERANKLLTKQIDEENLNLSKAEKAVQAKNAFGGFIPNFAQPVDIAFLERIKEFDRTSDTAGVKNIENLKNKISSAGYDETRPVKIAYDPWAEMQSISVQNFDKLSSQFRSSGVVGKVMLSEGNHRLQAMKKLGKKSILSDVIGGIPIPSGKGARPPGLPDSVEQELHDSFKQFSQLVDLSESTIGTSEEFKNLVYNNASSKGQLGGIFSSFEEDKLKFEKNLLSKRGIKDETILNNPSLRNKSLYDSATNEEWDEIEKFETNWFNNSFKNNSGISQASNEQKLKNWVDDTSRSFIHGTWEPSEFKLPNAAGGFIPNFADVILNKRGKNSTREITPKERVGGYHKSYLEYSKIPDNPDLLNLSTIKSYSKGHGLQMFNKLGTIARKSGRKVYSSMMIPQRSKLGDLSDKSSKEDILKAMYPQLLYRQRSESKNTELEFLFKETAKTLSGKNIFDIVKNEFKRTSSKNLINAFRNDEITISEVIDNFAGGFLPNFANPLQDAVDREMAAGVPASQIYIDKSHALKNAANPMGLMVANRRDEPAGGFQGINRARREGSNPMMYGAAGGFVPNYAAKLANKVQGSLGGQFGSDVKNAINDFATKASVAGSDLDALSKQLKLTLVSLGNSSKVAEKVAEESKKQQQEINKNYKAAQESRASKILEAESNKKLAKQLDKVYLEYNKSQKTNQDLQIAEIKAAALLKNTQLGAVSQKAIVASTGSLAATRSGASAGAGGNRDTLGIIFAVQGAMSALTGATDGATSGLGKFANSFGAVASTVSTAVFAGQGLSQAFGGAEKSAGRLVGKLGIYGAVIGGVVTAFNEYGKYVDSANPAMQKASEAALKLADAAGKASVNLSTLNPVQKDRVEKEASNLISGARNIKGGPFGVQRASIEGLSFKLNDDLKSGISQGLGVGVSYDEIYNEFNKYAESNLEVTATEAESLLKFIEEKTSAIANKGSTSEAIKFLKDPKRSKLSAEDLESGFGVEEQLQEFFKKAGISDKKILDENVKTAQKTLRGESKQKTSEEEAAISTINLELSKSQLKNTIELAVQKSRINDALDKELRSSQILNNLSEKQTDDLNYRIQLRDEERSLADQTKGFVLDQLNQLKDIAASEKVSKELQEELSKLTDKELNDKDKVEAIIKKINNELSLNNTYSEAIDKQNKGILQGFFDQFNIKKKGIELDKEALDATKETRDELNKILNIRNSISSKALFQNDIGLLRTQAANQKRIAEIERSKTGASESQIRGAQKEIAGIQLSEAQAKAVADYNKELINQRKTLLELAKLKTPEAISRVSELLENASNAKQLKEAAKGIPTNNLNQEDIQAFNNAITSMSEAFENLEVSSGMSIAAAEEQEKLADAVPPVISALEAFRRSLLDSPQIIDQKIEDIKLQQLTSISGKELLQGNYDIETLNQQRGQTKEEAARIARQRQNKGLGQLFAEEYTKTDEERALNINQAIVDGSVQFKNNMIEGIMGAVEGTSSLKDGLRSAAYEFIKMINQKMMSNLVDKVVGGNVQSGTGQTSGGLAGFFSNMFASGGKVTGGSGSKDDVPAMLMGGEYVVNKRAVSKYGPKFLEAINNGTLNGYAKGGGVQRGPQGNFYAPGSFGQGAIEGKMNLLDFATQTGTSGKFDQMINESGYQSISLEPESSRLSVSGMRNSPMFEATQSAKGQAFDLYLQQYNAEIEAKKQAKEKKKALRNQIIMMAASAALGPVVGAAGAGFSAAFKGASGQGFMSQVGAGFKGIVSGGTVGNQQVGGLSNLFSGAGKMFSGDFAGAANKFKLSQIANGNQLSDLYKSDPKFASYIDSIGGINTSGAPVVTSIISEAGSFSATRPNASVSSEAARFGSGIVQNGNVNNFSNDSNLGPPPPDDPTASTEARMLLGGFNPLLEDWLIRGGLKGFANGGMIPSTSGIDTVPAMLSGGEFVMNRSAVQSIGAPNLQSMNSGGTSITSEETSKELNEKLLAKLDELISASGSTGNITINVDSSGKSTENTSGGSSEGSQNLARQIRAAVLQVINEEKRIGGTLRR